MKQLKGSSKKIIKSKSLAQNVDATLPTAIHAVDLTKLSSLIGCTMEDLLLGIQHGGQTGEDGIRDMQGVVVDSNTDVTFETIGSSHDDINQSIPSSSLEEFKVTQALVTAASRPSALDTFDCPKCLINLGDKTILSHIISHLYLAGIERIVVSMAYGQSQIRKAIEAHPVYHKITIECLELGENNRDGHARSILSAEALFNDQPFLLHTADHIFDQSILKDLASCRDNSDIVVLMEEATQLHLSPTTVKIALDPAVLSSTNNLRQIAYIGRKLSSVDGIDAGLFLVSNPNALFTTLRTLAEAPKKPYFALADAIEQMNITSSGRVKALLTAGRTWFSIETQEQLAVANSLGDDSIISPWTVYLTRPPKKDRTPVLSSSLPQKSILFSMAEQDQSSSSTAATAAAAIHIVPNETDVRASNVFNGFVVGVGHVETSDAFSRIFDEATPLLLSPLRRRRSTFKSLASPTHAAESTEPCVVAIPVDNESTYAKPGGVGRANDAFLIEMKAEKTGEEEEVETILAIPEMPMQQQQLLEKAPPSLLQRSMTLPTDITDIVLETVGTAQEVQVVVTRSVPVVGFVLLASSLISVSAVGTAMDLQTNVEPLVKYFWRMSVTSLVLLPLAIRDLWLAKRKMTKATISLPFNLVKEMVLASASYVVFTSSFVLSLSMTSIGNAYIFGNTHSIIIVFGKALIGSSVLLLEGIGAVVGLSGCVLCTFDDTASTSTTTSAILPPAAPVKGDVLAFIGAIGGVAYLTLAKKLRCRMDLFVFMFLLTFIGTMIVLSYIIITGYTTISVSRDTSFGIFGWATEERLPLELFIVLFCNVIGTVGYVAVMKYFEPIVVSVVMLMEPVLASLFSYIVGIAGIPGLWTIVGGTLVIAGTSLVIVSNSQSTKAIDVSKALRSPRATAASTKA